MSDAEIIDKLGEVCDAIDRLTLVVCLMADYKDTPDAVAEVASPLMGEVVTNRSFSANKRIRVNTTKMREWFQHNPSKN